jgi:hypothetical protein
MAVAVVVGTSATTLESVTIIYLADLGECPIGIRNDLKWKPMYVIKEREQEEDMFVTITFITRGRPGDDPGDCVSTIGILRCENFSRVVKPFPTHNNITHGQLQHSIH